MRQNPGTHGGKVITMPWCYFVVDENEGTQLDMEGMTTIDMEGMVRDGSYHL